MHFNRTKILLCTLVTGVPLALCAQQGRWNELHARSIELSNEGRYAEAIPLAKHALDVAEATFEPEDPRVANSLHLLGLIYRNTRDKENYAKAELLLKRAIEIREKAVGPEHPDTADILNELGELYYQEGNYSNAEPLLKRALAVYDRALGPEHPYVAASANNLGTLYRDMGNYADAERLLRRALAIIENASAENQVHVADAEDNLAGLYLDQGKYIKAELSYRRGLEIREKALGPDHPDVAESLRDLGELYVEAGEYTEAEPLLKRALKLYEKGGPDNAYVASSLHSLALLYDRQLKYEVAEALYRRSLAIYEKVLGSYDGNVGSVLEDLALLYFKKGNYSNAEPLLMRAHKIQEKALGPNHPAVARLLSNLALLRWALKDSNGAAAYFEQSQAILSKVLDQQFAYMSERDRLGYLDKVAYHFPLYFSFCYTYRVHRPDLVGKMYDQLLWEKGMVASSVAAQRVRLMTSGDSQTLALFDQLMFRRNQLAALARAPGLGLDQWQQVFTLRGEANALESELTRRSASFNEETRLKQPSWQQIRHRLEKSEAAIEFVRFKFTDGKKPAEKDYYAALVVRPTTTQPKLVPLGEATDLEGRPMDDYRHSVLIKGLSASEFGLEFYRAFWKPLETELNGIKRVYVSPDGVLNQISWVAIPTDEGRLLTEKYDVQVLLSTKDVLREWHSVSDASAVLIGNPKFDLSDAELRAAVASLQTNEGPQSNCADLGEQVLSSEQTARRDSKGLALDVALASHSTEEQAAQLEPLTETHKEMASLSGLFKKQGWRVDSYCRQYALEEVIKRIKSPRLLHVATHGFFKPLPKGSGYGLLEFEDPMLRSGLYFAGADRTLAGEAPLEGVENGVLTAYEAAGLNLQGTELVVLSACETGLGRVTNGEGVFGLQRALQEAGAEAVLMSMWPVPDPETQTLMTLFYEKWQSGMEKHQALHEAQMELRRELQLRWQVDQPPPHFWAAFVLVGR